MYNKPETKFSAGAMTKLEEQPWYGNIRELQHAMEKAVIPVSYTHLDVYKRQPPEDVALPAAQQPPCRHFLGAVARQGDRQVDVVHHREY